MNEMAESLSVAATVNQSICSKQTSEEMYVSTRTRREKYISRNEELIRPEDIHVEIKNSETHGNMQKADEQEDIDLGNTDSAYQCEDIPERIQQNSSNTAHHDDQKVRRIGMVEATEEQLTQKRRQQTRVLLKKFGEDMETAVDMPRIFTKKL